MNISDGVLSVIQRVGVLVIALAAIIVWVTMGSSEQSPDAYASAIDTAMSKDKINASSAESAPQQAVVVGWTARDLSEIQARMTAADSRDDDRIAAELVLLILAVCWIALTGSLPVRRRLQDRAAGPLTSPAGYPSMASPAGMPFPPVQHAATGTPPPRR